MIFGPISDAVNEKLGNDMPDDFVVASKCLRHHLFNKIALSCTVAHFVVQCCIT